MLSSVGAGLARDSGTSVYQAYRGGLKFTLALAIVAVVCFIAIAGLMGAKPV